MTAKSFTTLLQDLPKKKDCGEILQVQKNTLRKYEETNEMLKNFLELSENTHEVLLEKFTAHSRTLTTLKKDLEICFKRIRVLKTKLQAKYPEAFEATADAIKELQERYKLDEDDDYRPPDRTTEENTRKECSDTENLPPETVDGSCLEMENETCELQKDLSASLVGDLGTEDNSFLKDSGDESGTDPGLACSNLTSTDNQTTFSCDTPLTDVKYETNNDVSDET